MQPDVVTSSFSDNTIAWYENVNHGATWVQHLISTTALGAERVFVELRSEGALSARGNVVGTYLHGLFASGPLSRSLL